MPHSRLVFLVAVLPTLGRADDLVPLKVDIPRVPFDKTVPHALLDDPHIDHPPDPNRTPLRVSRDTVNLAYEMSVTTSDKAPTVGSADQLTDNINEGTEGSWTELAPGSQWVQIDLREPCPIEAIVFWHLTAEARVYHDVIVQACDRAAFDKDVRTLFNNDADNSAGRGKGADREYLESENGKLVPTPGLRARYVRLYTNGSTVDGYTHWTEVQVFGRPGPILDRFHSLRRKRLDSVETFLAFLDSRQPGAVRYEDGKPIALATGQLESPADLAMAARIPTLRELTLSGDVRWGDLRTAPASFPKLKKLDVLQAPRVAEFFITRDLPAIEHLALSAAYMGAGVPRERLHRFKTLRTLHLLVNKGDDTDFRYLAALSNLTTLTLAGSDLTGFSPPKFAGLDNLKELDLSDTQLPALKKTDLGSLNPRVHVILTGAAVPKP